MTLAASKAKLLYYTFLTAANKFPSFCNARLGPKISNRTKADQCKKEAAALFTEWIANTNKADATDLTATPYYNQGFVVEEDVLCNKTNGADKAKASCKADISKRALYFDATSGVCKSNACGKPADIHFYKRGPMNMAGVIDYWWFS